MTNNQDTKVDILDNTKLSHEPSNKTSQISDSDRFKIQITTLASYSNYDYEKNRKTIAKAHNISVSYLDREVEKLREKNKTSYENKDFKDIKPWPEPVDGNDLVEGVAEKFSKYAVLPEGALILLVLWTLGTYCFDSFRKWPRLLISSPDHECGKTTLLEILSALCFKPYTASNITVAAIFRLIEDLKPTLIIDESDTFIYKNKEMHGIINSGYTKSHAHAVRSNTGQKGVIQRFSTWAAMVIGMIGMPTPTILSRCLVVLLQRKLPNEKADEINFEFETDCEQLSRKMLRWAEDNKEHLKHHTPTLPSFLDNRTKDNWAPLFSMAELIGGTCHNQVIEAYKSHPKQESASTGTLLLSDIKYIFEEKNCESIHSNDLVNALLTLDESSWGEFRGTRSLTAAALANLLKPYGIKSKQLRISDFNRNGYCIEMFEDAFLRYVPGSFIQPSSPLGHAKNNDSQTNTKFSSSKTVESIKPINTNNNTDCRVVEGTHPPFNKKGKKQKSKKPQTIRGIKNVSVN